MVKPPWTSVREVSYKTKHVPTIRPSSCTLGHLSQRHENLHSHKNLPSNVQSSFICNSQKLETTQMSRSERMVSQRVQLPYHEILPSENREQTHDNLDESPSLGHRS